MKFFQKRSVAVIVMVLAILAAVGIGRVKGASGRAAAPGTGLDSSLDTAYYEQFIYDQADVLNNSAEKQLAVYLANWDARYNSIVAFMSVSSVSGDPEDYAYDLAEDYDLGDGDALLLVVKSSDEYRFIWGDDFDTIMNTKSMDRLSATMDSGSWQDCVLTFYSVLNNIYVENFGVGNGSPGTQGISGYNPGYRVGGVNSVVLVAIFAIIVILLLSAIDRSRYNTYRSQYYGVVNPPVVFRPIFFWHGPRYGWYQRHWHQPPPPPPPRPGGPGGFVGTPPGRPSSSSRPSGSSRPTGSAGGFGGVGNRGPRGTGFDRGGSFGGTRGSGSFGGSSFGGGSRPKSSGSFGGSRGSFGGGRSGGFSGGSRGGSFGGGSRGGGFGGRR